MPTLTDLPREIIVLIRDFYLCAPFLINVEGSGFKKDENGNKTKVEGYTRNEKKGPTIIWKLLCKATLDTLPAVGFPSRMVDMCHRQEMFDFAQSMRCCPAYEFLRNWRDGRINKRQMSFEWIALLVLLRSPMVSIMRTLFEPTAEKKGRHAPKSPYKEIIEWDPNMCVELAVKGCT